MTDKLDMTSPDLVSQNINKIAALFPNCVTESANGLAIDFDQLKQELSKDIVEGNKERYRLEWPGKREAIVTANLPINKTLRPARAESVDFDNTENLYIEGDNLEVLKLLQESYLGKIKMIYIDPPYNTGKDFVYKDNFTQDSDEYQEEAGLKDEYNNRLVANPDTSGRYHSDWLSMIYPRLKLARNLLTDDGVIFISIDDNEVHNLRKICDEVFGEGNFVECITWNKRIPKNDKGIGNIHEYILLYVKDYSVDHQFLMEKDGLKDIEDLLLKLQKQNINIDEAEKEIKKLYKKNGYDRGITLYNSLDKNYKLWGKINMSWPNAETMGPRYEILHPITKKSVKIPERGWRWKIETFNEAAKYIDGNYTSIEELLDGSLMCGRIWFSKDETTQPSSVTYLSEVNNFLLRSILSFKSDGGIEVESIFDKKNYFSYPKTTTLLKTLIKSINSKDKEAIILDFFSGSATTAHSVMQLNAEDGGNRKYIMVQVPEKTDEKSDAFKAGFDNICEIGKERIRRAAKLISDNQNKINKSSDLKIDFGNEIKSKVDYGFRVYKLDSSNMQDVHYTPNQYEQGQLDLLSDNIKPDRNSDDLVAQIMLDWGLPLSLKIEHTKIANKEVFKVADDALLCCFDEGIDEAFAKEIATLKPLRIVFRDKSFKDDTAKENVKQLLKQLSPDSEMKVI